MANYDIFQLGYDKSLTRGGEANLDALGTGSFTPSADIMPDLGTLGAGDYTGGITQVPTETITPGGTITSGGLTATLNQSNGALYNGKVTFTDTTAGYRLGLDTTDNQFKFIIGVTGSSMDWNVTAANTLTITGSINVTTGGTVGGFNVGSDYIRDVANTFGLASTVTGGDDVRIWAGAAFANRATASARIYESGAFHFGSSTQYVDWNGSALTLAGDLININTSTGAVQGNLQNIVSLVFGEAINGTTTPVAVYLKSSDGKVYKCDADLVGEASEAFLGFVTTNVSSGASGSVQISGLIAVPSQTLTSATSGADQFQHVAVTATALAFQTTAVRYEQSFKVGDQVGNISSVEFWAANINGNPVAVVELYAIDSVGKPTGAVLATSNSVTVTGASALRTFTFASPYSVRPGDTYAAVLKPTTCDASNGFNLQGAATAALVYNYVMPSATNGVGATNQWYSLNSGSTWNTIATAYFTTNYSSQIFQIGDPIFLSGTAGGFTFTRPTTTEAVVMKVARLISSTLIIIESQKEIYLGTTNSAGANSAGAVYIGAPPRAEKCLLTMVGGTTASNYGNDNVEIQRGSKSVVVGGGAGTDGHSFITATWTGNMIVISGTEQAATPMTAYFYT